MAPRRRRSKVGLTRMDAALDAMRPMGFSSAVVRKCVKNLLKVYGNNGWVFIEEAAYKLLIDTILEEPEVPRLESASNRLLLEDGSHESHQQTEPVHQLCGKEVICPDQVISEDTNINIKKEVKQEHELVVVNVEKEIKQEQQSDYNLPLASLQVAAQLSLPLPYTTPQSTNTIPTNRRRRPCYGWISDDEDDNDDEDYNFMQLAPAH